MSQLYEIGYSRQEAARQVVKELTNLGCKTTPRAVADWRDGFKSLPAADELGKIYRTMLANENDFISRDHRIDHVQDEQTRNKWRQKITETLRKFVLLARLTSNPDLSKVLPKLKSGARQL